VSCALVAKFATAALFARSHIPTPYQAQLVAASARFWRKIGAPRAVRPHLAHCACIARRAPPRTDGRWEPARGFDLPHWRGAIYSKYDQDRSLPCGATFEAIPGVRHRILVPDGDGAPLVLAENAQCLCVPPSSCGSLKSQPGPSERRCVTLLSDLTSLHLSLYFCFIPRASPSRRITSS
jgi:hypothetical protein